MFGCLHFCRLHKYSRYKISDGLNKCLGDIEDKVDAAKDGGSERSAGAKLLDMVPDAAATGTAPPPSESNGGQRPIVPPLDWLRNGVISNRF